MITKRGRRQDCNGIFFGDTHAGCQLALCPPDGVMLDNGGRYMPSTFQLKIWAWWRELWDAWVPEATDGEPFFAVHMGDALDGVHHRATTQISQNLTDQARIGLAILRPVVKAARRGYYHVRGTEVHVGASADQEERLAQELGAVPHPQLGTFARYELWKRVGPRLVHAMHHISTTGSQHYESTAVHKELMEGIVEAGRWNREIPDVEIRGHRHREIGTETHTYKGEARSLVCPGWQGKTPFTFKIAGARQSEPQFGAILIRWSEKRQELFVRKFIKALERGPVE